MYGRRARLSSGRHLNHCRGEKIDKSWANRAQKFCTHSLDIRDRRVGYHGTVKSQEEPSTHPPNPERAQWRRFSNKREAYQDLQIQPLRWLCEQRFKHADCGTPLLPFNYVVTFLIVFLSIPKFPNPSPTPNPGRSSRKNERVGLARYLRFLNRWMGHRLRA